MAIHEYDRRGVRGVQTLMSVGDDGCTACSNPQLKSALKVGAAVAVGMIVLGTAKKAVKWGALGAVGYYLMKKYA